MSFLFVPSLGIVALKVSENFLFMFASVCLYTSTVLLILSKLLNRKFRKTILEKVPLLPTSIATGTTNMGQMPISNLILFHRHNSTIFNSKFTNNIKAFLTTTSNQQLQKLFLSVYFTKNTQDYRACHTR